MRISEAQSLWEPAGVYCNTASYGLPPRPAWEALQAALTDWHGGRTSWEHWGQSTEGARSAFARLVNVEVGRVAVGSTVSELVGSVVTALPAGTRVAVPDIEFSASTSAPSHPPGWSRRSPTASTRSHSARSR
jgi:selenocysteine lyase/cysteine desulfurase